MKFKSLKSRMAFIFLTMILIIQITGALSLHYSIQKNASNSVDEQLKVGERVFRSLLDQNGENLTQSARILANDYGFRQAIGSNDSETIISALNNNQSRINADIAIFYSPVSENLIISGKLSQNEVKNEVEVLIKNTVANGSGRDFKIFRNKPYQLVAVPVKAPLTIGWIVMGFEINNNLAKKLNKLSNLDVTFIYKSEGRQWTYAATTLGDASATELINLTPNNIAREPDITKIFINGTEYGSRFVGIFSQKHQGFYAVLQQSLDIATAPYKALQFNLFILSTLGAIIFIVGIIYVSKIISLPLTELVSTAKKLEEGQYDTHVDTERLDEIGNLGRAFNSMSEAISSREQSILKLAYWDKLTELPNHAAFLRQLFQSINEAKRHKNPVSVLVMNLDRFKQINNVLGHELGNKLLLSVADRIKQSVKRSSDYLARLGGDEFAVLLPFTNVTDALKVASMLKVDLETPIDIDGQQVDISASIGIASFPDDSDNYEQLLARAEIAMHVAKKRQSGVIVFEDGFDMSSQDNLSLASDLKAAITHQQFSLYLQPKVDLKTGNVHSLEALIRWIHPEKGLIFPDQFIPFAEQTGLIHRISLWVLNEAAKYHALWKSENIFLPIAVNLSARDLIDHDLPSKLEEILELYQISSQGISLEITESSIMDDPKRAQLTLEQLANMGFNLAIDDFGTGYSSLAYLKRLPVNELKIDKSFVLNMKDDKNDTKIVRSTVDLGHNLNLKVVAEGVESLEVWKSLLDIGCDYGQGYYISKPIPVKDFIIWLQNWENLQQELLNKNAI